MYVRPSRSLLYFVTFVILGVYVLYHLLFPNSLESKRPDLTRLLSRTVAPGFAKYLSRSVPQLRFHRKTTAVYVPRKKISFKGFNNITGTDNGELIVPNVIHYIRFRKSYISFVDAVCILSAFKNHKPDFFVFHTDVRRFTGPYWKKVISTPGLVVRFHKIQMPNLIFGKKISKEFHDLHATEFMKVTILRKVGGIVLDNDIYVVKSLNTFRKFEMTVGWEDRACISTRVLIAHKDARFLKLWYNSFREYVPNKWYYNVGCKPTKDILSVKPDLVHREETAFGLRSNAQHLYKDWDWHDWKKFYTLPVLMRHSNLSPVKYKWLPKFDDKMILYYPMAFGEMARDVYQQ